MKGLPKGLGVAATGKRLSRFGLHIAYVHDVAAHPDPRASRSSEDEPSL